MKLSIYLNVITVSWLSQSLKISKHDYQKPVKNVTEKHNKMNYVFITLEYKTQNIQQAESDKKVIIITEILIVTFAVEYQNH